MTGTKVGSRAIRVGLCAVLAIASTACTVVRVSEGSDGAQANAASESTAISADGRYIAFSSQASNLVPGDDNTQRDVFVKDVDTGIVKLVSADSSEAVGNGPSVGPAISDDGRYVAFVSAASNLVPGDTDFDNVFVKDLTTGSVTMVDTDSSGAPAEGNAGSPDISADGRYVSFQSDAWNITPDEDTNEDVDVFVKDLNSGATELVSTDGDGNQLDCGSFIASLNSSARFVAFFNCGVLVRKDRDTGALDLVSDNVSFWAASLSDDGRYVGFTQFATSTTPGDTNGVEDQYVRDMATEVTTRASTDSTGGEANAASTGGVLSGDGRYVAFTSNATNLVADDTNEVTDIFVKDLLRGTTTRVSRNLMFAESNGTSTGASISTDGRYVAFVSQATNLNVGSDTNGVADVFRAIAPAYVNPTSPNMPCHTPLRLTDVNGRLIATAEHAFPASETSMCTLLQVVPEPDPDFPMAFRDFQVDLGIPASPVGWVRLTPAVRDEEIGVSYMIRGVRVCHVMPASVANYAQLGIFYYDYSPQINRWVRLVRSIVDPTADLACMSAFRLSPNVTALFGTTVPPR